MPVNLQNDPIWNQLDGLSRRIGPETLALAHIEEWSPKLTLARNKIRGYWHGNEHYEEIFFTSPLRAELESISVKSRRSVPQDVRSVKMSFLLFGGPIVSESISVDDDYDEDDDDDEVGELTLVFNSKMEFVDENWIIDVESPFVVAKRRKEWARNQ